MPINMFNMFKQKITIAQTLKFTRFQLDAHYCIQYYFEIYNFKYCK